MSTAMPAPLEDILETFDLLDSWEDRYRYLIDLGRGLPPLDPGERNDANKVPGCASQVWLVTVPESGTADRRITFKGESDAHIVQGLIALLLALYSGKSAEDILKTDASEIFRQVGLSEHLTPQRSNGVRSMVERIKRDASLALQSA